MKVLEKISDLISKYMIIVVIAVAGLALFEPVTLGWISTKWIDTLLGIAMFGMGLTLRPSDFKIVFSRPKEVIIGTLAQFVLMPLIAFILVHIFQLPTELAVGVILAGTCPSGTGSNVMNFLAKADVPLSLGITSVCTILAPILTPFLTLIYAGQSVDVNLFSMFLSITKVIIVPLVLGFIFTKFFSKLTERLLKVLPLISITAITLIIASVVSVNSSKIMTAGAVIIIVVILHNLLGYAAGFGIAKLFRISTPKATTVSIEVGTQNSGLATSLAISQFAMFPMAAIPGAMLTVWQNISGSIYSNLISKVNEKYVKIDDEYVKSEA